MEISRKKVLLIGQDVLLSENGGLMDFHLRQDVLDRIKSLNIGYVAILFRDGESMLKMKAVEYIVFIYCKVGVSTHADADRFLDDVMSIVPNNMKRKDFFLSVGEKINGIDNINIEDFL